MNAAAAALISRIQQLGYAGLAFSVTSIGRRPKFSKVLAWTASARKPSECPDVTPQEIFTAYALAPRIGEYKLEVDSAVLAFEALAVARPGATKRVMPGAKRKKSAKRRAKAKASTRRP